MDISLSSRFEGLRTNPPRLNKFEEMVVPPAQWVSKDSVTFSGRKNRLKFQRRLQREKAAVVQSQENAQEAFRVVVRHSPILAQFLKQSAKMGDTIGDQLLALQFLKMGAHPNQASADTQETPLALALQNGQFSLVRNLLKAGADPNQKSGTSGRLPIQLAVKKGQIPAARFLLQAGAKPHLQDNLGNSALTEAIQADQPEFLEEMLNQGESPDARNGEGTPLLVLAALQDKQQAAQKLLAHSAKVNLQDANGYTALACAALNNSFEQCELLLWHGANPLLQNKRGFSAVDYADANRLVFEDNRVWHLLQRFLPANQQV